MLVRSRQRIAAIEDNIGLSLSNSYVGQVQFTKCLGVTLDKSLTWDAHLQSIRQNVYSFE